MKGNNRKMWLLLVGSWLQKTKSFECCCKSEHIVDHSISISDLHNNIFCISIFQYLWCNVLMLSEKTSKNLEGICVQLDKLWGRFLSTVLEVLLFHTFLQGNCLLSLSKELNTFHCPFEIGTRYTQPPKLEFYIGW